MFCVCSDDDARGKTGRHLGCGYSTVNDCQRSDGVAADDNVRSCAAHQVADGTTTDSVAFFGRSAKETGVGATATTTATTGDDETRGGFGHAWHADRRRAVPSATGCSVGEFKCRAAEPRRDVVFGRVYLNSKRTL